jgi:hypothetical protein
MTIACVALALGLHMELKFRIANETVLNSTAHSSTDHLVRARRQVHALILLGARDVANNLADLPPPLPYLMPTLLSWLQSLAEVCLDEDDEDGYVGWADNVERVRVFQTCVALHPPSHISESQITQYLECAEEWRIPMGFAAFGHTN